MAQDPYGFDDAKVVAGAGIPATPTETVMWYGIGAAVFAIIAPCTCWMGYFVALPLGGYAAYLGYRLRDGAADARDRAMATAGMVTGGTAAVIGAVFLFILACYMLLYVGLFGFIAAGLADQ